MSPTGRRLLLALLCVAPPASAATLQIDPRPIHTFDASTAFGATVDAHPHGETAQAFTPENVQAMLSIGFQPVSYRLITELAGEAWHWNPRGTWSDPWREEGYWTSSSEGGDPIAVSYGYRLPRRGNTLDQAQNDGYSRIDDGDLSTFWKSNPYLDEHFAGDPHPQWIVADLGSARGVSSVRIAWGEPYAIAYRVQYWDGVDPINAPGEGDWIDFPGGSVSGGRGGDVVLRLAQRRTRYLRIVMTQSSNTSDRRSSDIRDRLGFAVRELWIGDLLRHGRTREGQSVIWVSSTDPWHRATDVDLDTEQLGFDALFAIGITRGRDVLMPVALIYGTPEDAAAEIDYLKRRGHPLSFVEVGEEPDGQNVSPEDYSALYRQWAAAIHRIDPHLRLGGPGFQSTIDYVAYWRDADGTTAWLTRFLADLRRHGRIGDLSFFSFEWYPFDNLCTSVQRQIEGAPALLRGVLQRWRREGLPDTIPWIATEYGYSSYAGQPEVDIFGALFNSEFVAEFLSLGGSAAYFYSYEPDVLLREQRCPTWGNLTPFLSDEQHHIRYKLATYWAARMVTSEWSGRSGRQEVYRARVDDRHVGAYALLRADGTWSVMLINRGTRAVTVRIPLTAELRVTQYSPEQYVWKANGERGHPIKDLPPVTIRAPRPAARGLRLPPHSITVATGNR